MKLANPFFRQEETILRETEKFFKALTHLRYEGKAFREKNLKAVNRTNIDLESKLKAHRGLQEKILFPFLEKHIPRQEMAIHLLETEHADIAENQKKLKTYLRKLLKNPGNQTDQGVVYHTGLYLVALLRHHVKFEIKSLLKSLQKELRPQERKEMAVKATQWLNKQNFKITKKDF